MHPVRLGKYEVIRKIASGGMAEVYLCAFRGEGGFEKKVAVKVVHPRLSDDPRFQEMFAREARVAATLSHQNLVQVFDFGREGRSYYLAMEYVAGWTLAQAAAQSRQKSAPVPPGIWRHWVEGMLGGIACLHSRGVLHRDVSPSNVLLTRGGAVKLADFGIARSVRPGDGQDRAPEGKYSYMSPELARGEEASRPSDIFAAAVVAAELYLPGRMFPGDDPAEILGRIRRFDPRELAGGAFPPEVEGILLKGLAARAEERYPDIAAFAEAVRAAVPAAAGGADIAAYWDALFGATPPDEEATIAVGSSLDEPLPDRVRERSAAYGGIGNRWVKIGAAFTLVAAAVAGPLVFTENRRREHVPPSSSVPVRPLPADLVRTASPLPDVHPTASVQEVRKAHALPLPMVGPAALPPVSGSMPEKEREDLAARPAANRGETLVETDPQDVSVVLEDGTLLGRTPVRIDFNPWAGEKIVFRRDGYEEKRIKADVLAALPSFRTMMELQTGTFEAVNAIPWAKVYEGDRLLGETAFGPLTLPVGEHRLRFVNDDLKAEKEVKVRVRKGINPNLIVPLVGQK